ncbi:Pycsar system effector family protein [Sphingomonas profundi]|uniref:Pycsar system effector family protein n=1 Tax=Alterirhizorhabdus profundi TaxID=2681549 RepID=UPI001E4FA7DE|nr:Pycsar system effector family protein [Sphingomonas profundi]
MAEDQPDAPPRRYSPNAVHLVRTTQTTHYQLSQMADQKASILMGATFVIFTITIGQAKGGAGAPLPMLILGGFAFVSAVLAVLAILPATHMKQRGPINLLFFGSFSHLAQEDYIERVLDVLQDDETIYRTMVNDIYQNGRVLDRKKYRMLGYAYRVFLVGLTASLIAFVAQYATRAEGGGAAAAPARHAAG